MAKRNVVIVSALCGRERAGFGMRVERIERRRWALTWAFAMTPAVAAREGYDKTKVNGSFENDVKYPGCPHCGNHGFYKCGCGQIACWNGQQMRVTCPACRVRITLGGTVTSLAGGGDR